MANEMTKAFDDEVVVGNSTLHDSSVVMSDIFSDVSDIELEARISKDGHGGSSGSC